MLSFVHHKPKSLCPRFVKLIIYLINITNNPIINSCSPRLKNTMTEESSPDDVGK